uniref:BAG domain-containing protein n=1 Tax=Anopheles farauti TaxID=69004 RepID=A0A182QW13_9DIPT
MSQPQDQQPQQQQPTVRHIPIFVEGRSEPLVNTQPESQPSSQSSQHHHHHHPTAGMDSPGMEMPSRNDFFNHGSIFEKARHIPVRNQFPSAGFMSGFKREPSPGGATRTSPFADIGNHMRPDGDPLNVSRGSSIPRQTPSPPTANHQPQQQQHQHSQQNVPRTAAQPPPPPPTSQDQPDSRPKAPIKDDPITKIQKIQKDVLAIFDQVEQFKGGKEGKKDKAYVYLDEMLTQNLLKLDSIDAEDQPQIKSARKEAIKSINTCIAVLEAKAEAGAACGSTNASTGSIGGNASSTSNGIDAPNGTEQSASNTSIPHSSSNSSQQQQPNEESKQ